MKKIIVLFLAFLTIVSCGFTACARECELVKFVSDSKTDLFYGESSKYKLKCDYGFSETVKKEDGKVSSTAYYLNFKLLNVSDNAEYLLTVRYGDVQKDGYFSVSPVSGYLTAKIQADNFVDENFTVTISSGGTEEQITMVSIIPEGVVDYKTALASLCESRKTLIDSYRNDYGVFEGEIHVRIIVKDDKAYWYVARINGEGVKKALLMDGVNCEVKAIRDIIR